MAKVDGSLHSLIQGVSQQPFKVMLPTQCRLQENMSSNPVNGLTRRPPTDFLFSLGQFTTEPQFYEFSTGGVDYTLAATPGNVRMWRLDGNEVPITISSDAAAYLGLGKLAFTTLKGDVYIANTAVPVKMLAGAKTYANKSSIVHLNGGQYGRDYIVTVRWSGNTATFHYLTPNGSTSTDTPKVASTYIADQLVTNFNANGTLTGTFHISRADDVLLIESNSGTLDFQVTVDDGAGNSVAFATNNSVIDVGSLPRYAPEGYFCAISGASSADSDDYYLAFHTNDDASAIGTGFGKAGVWKETVQRDIPYRLDHNTMPVILHQDVDTNLFSIALGDWADRQVGDDLVTNEDPSFVGLTIKGMSSFQSRLMMLAGQNVIMSRTNKPLDFWRETATKQVDTDPIDIFSTAKDIGTMRVAIPFDRDIIVFADRGEKIGGAQFIIFGRNAITPQNCSLVLTTTYEADVNADPVAAGKNIFFATQYGKYTGVREFFTEIAADSNNSRPITEHVLKYIKGNVVHMSSSENFNLLLVSADVDPKSVFAYEYIWQDNKKAQSSWSTWIFKNKVFKHFLVNGVAYFVTVADDGTYMLERMNLDAQDDDGVVYQAKLDSRVVTVNVHTTMPKPLPVMPDINDMLFVQGAGCPHPGLLVNVQSYNGTTITFTEDMQGGDIISGVRYMSRYKPNMPFVRDKDGVAITEGKLVINHFLVNFTKTGFIGSKVTSKYMADRELTFTGRYVDDPNTVVGSPAIIDGSFRVPFRQDANLAELELFNDTNLPMTITDLPWVGQYTATGKHISTGN